MSLVVSSARTARAAKVTPPSSPSSPPDIRRSSQGCGGVHPTNTSSVSGKIREINDLSTNFELLAATASRPPLPIAKRKGKHRKVSSWKLGDDDISAISEGSSIFEAVISKESVEKEDSSSCTSKLPRNPTVKRHNKPHVGGGGNEISAIDISQSVDEYAARHKEIIHKRERKKRKNKKKSAKHECTVCNDVSTDSIDRRVSATQQDTRSDVEIDQKNPIIDGDRESDVSRGSSTSSIFAATRGRLKGYLTRRKNENKGQQKGPTTDTSSQLSPALNSTKSSEQSQDELSPIALLSNQESKVDSSHEDISSTILCTPTSSSSQYISEEIISQISPLTPEASDEDKSPSSIVPSSSAKPYLPSINLFPERDFTTRVTNLPWSKNSSSKSREQQLKGKYSGPVNDFLQPHGKGNLVLIANSSLTFSGTWKDGKLVSPLTVEKEPMTYDKSFKERRSDEPFTGPKFAADKNRRSPNHRIPIDAPTAKEHVPPIKLNKKPRKPKSKPLVGYKIGDACRTPQDMTICNSRQEAIKSASLLKKWDGAFIKRSCGLWTYAILIERAPQPVDIMKRRLEYCYWTTVWKDDPRYEMQDSMLFAINGNGGTKIIPKDAWAKYVRRMNPNSVPNSDSAESYAA